MRFWSGARDLNPGPHGPRNLSAIVRLDRFRGFEFNPRNQEDTGGHAVAASAGHAPYVGDVHDPYRSRALPGRPIAELSVLVISLRPCGSIALRREAVVLAA